MISLIITLVSFHTSPSAVAMNGQWASCGSSGSGGYGLQDSDATFARPDLSSFLQINIPDSTINRITNECLNFAVDDYSLCMGLNKSSTMLVIVVW